MSQEVKKLIDWETFTQIYADMFKKRCRICEHIITCYDNQEPHPTCPIWAGLEDAGLRVREIDTANEPDDDPSPMF